LSVVETDAGGVSEICLVDEDEDEEEEEDEDDDDEDDVEDEVAVGGELEDGGEEEVEDDDEPDPDPEEGLEDSGDGEKTGVYDIIEELVAEVRLPRGTADCWDDCAVVVETKT